MNRDRIHRFANLAVGFDLPRWWVRELSERKLKRLLGYVLNTLCRANDDSVIPAKRPRWLPKRYL